MDKIDPLLGRLKLENIEESEWSGIVKIDSGDEVRLYLCLEDIPFDEGVSNSSKNFKQFKKSDKIYREQVADDLLELYNSTWRPAGCKELTKQGFIEKIRAISIRLYGDGEMTIWYDDGDLFAGHLINIDISSDGTSTASLNG